MKRFFFLSILISVSALAAQRCNNAEDIGNPEIPANVQAASSSVKKNRIYLDPKKIVPTNEGIFFQVDCNTMLLLPTLYSDDNGCFVKCNGLETPFTYKCPYCGITRSVYAPNCPNSECPSNQ